MTGRIFVLAAGNERGGGASHLLALASALQQSSSAWQFTFVIIGQGYLTERLLEANATVRVIEGGTRSVVPTVVQLVETELRGAGKTSTLLHAHGPRMNIFACRIAQRAGILWTSTLHSDPYQDFLSSWWKQLLFSRLNVFCLHRAAAVFAVSQELAGKVPGKKAFLVKNAVALRPLLQEKEVYRHALRNRLRISDQSSVIGMAARLNPVKDIPTALKGFANLVALLPDQQDVHLAIAGEGPARHELESLADQLGVRSRVHFLGFVDQVSEFFAGLDIHVLSSISEGTGLSTLEAGYYGVVNVGTAIDGVRQLITHNETGLLFPVGSAIRLAEELKRLLEDKSLQMELARSFQETVVPEFSPHRMLDTYVAGYQELFGGRSLQSV